MRNAPSWGVLFLRALGTLRGRTYLIFSKHENIISLGYQSQSLQSHRTCKRTNAAVFRVDCSEE